MCSNISGNSVFAKDYDKDPLDESHEESHSKEEDTLQHQHRRCEGTVKAITDEVLGIGTYEPSSSKPDAHEPLARIKQCNDAHIAWSDFTLLDAILQELLEDCETCEGNGEYESAQGTHTACP